MRAGCRAFHRERRSAGFSLIELLVVIGIIALLIAILLPALVSARESGKRMECMSNLRQMAIAAQVYVNTYRGAYPIAYYFAGNGAVTYCYQWDQTTITELGQPTRIVPGILWEGRGPMRMNQCPSFEGRSDWFVDPCAGYNYNTSYIGHGEYEATVAPARASAIRRPAETALFGDAQYRDGANKWMRAPFRTEADTGSERWRGTQGFRHRKLTNVVFCDGHGESLRERFTANDDGAENVADGTGFLSADNRMYGGS